MQVPCIAAPVACSVLDVHNVVATLVLLLVHNRADAAIVVAARHHCQVTQVKLDEVSDLARLQVKHHRVLLLDLCAQNQTGRQQARSAHVRQGKGTWQ